MGDLETVITIYAPINDYLVAASASAGDKT